MEKPLTSELNSPEPLKKPQRRPRYSGKNPRTWDQKYKEHRGDADTVEHVQSRGKTPAGRHIPILVEPILQCLQLRPGMLGVDCTLGWGGHAEAILDKILPGGMLIGFDQDPIQLPVTEARFREAGFSESDLILQKSNFGGVGKTLEKLKIPKVEFLLADLGLSSMQIDNPARGFSYKSDGPLDMRMNPTRGLTAQQWLLQASPEKLIQQLAENADEPEAVALSKYLAGKDFPTTTALRRMIEKLIPDAEIAEATVRRVFQALRITVNEEFSSLDSLLRQLPQVLASGGRAAFLTFHSGEDRRVKKAIQWGIQSGEYTATNREVIRASPEELRANPRSSSAKLRWVERS